MGLFDFFKRSQQQPKSNVGYYISSGGNSAILAGYKPLNKNADVKLCVNKIADLVSNMTLMLMQNEEKGDVRVKNGLSRVLDIAPNKHMTRKTFIQAIITEALLKGNGNCIVVPHFDRSYYLQSLEILDMDRVSFLKSNDSYKIIYCGQEIDPQTVLHFVFNPSQTCPFFGEGYAPILKDTIENLTQANATKRAFFESKYTPSLIISVNADSEELMDKEQRQKILDSYTTSSNRGTPFLIPSGEVQIDQIKPLTLQDLALNESVTLERKVVASAFGIPPFMVGLGEFDRNEYNNFIQQTILSFAKIIEQELTKKLLISDSMYFKFNSRSLMQYNITELAEVGKELVSLGVCSRNEIRDWFDLSPIDSEGMTNFSTLENYIPVDMVSNQKKLIQDDELEGEPIEK